jgi:hypothetical protein
LCLPVERILLYFQTSFAGLAGRTIFYVSGMIPLSTPLKPMSGRCGMVIGNPVSPGFRRGVYDRSLGILFAFRSRPLVRHLGRGDGSPCPVLPVW